MPEKEDIKIEDLPKAVLVTLFKTVTKHTFIRPRLIAGLLIEHQSLEILRLYNEMKTILGKLKNNELKGPELSRAEKKCSKHTKIIKRLEQSSMKLMKQYYPEKMKREENGHDIQKGTYDC